MVNIKANSGGHGFKLSPRRATRATYVARLRIGAVFEDRDHLPTLEPMSSPSMADPMRCAPTSLLAPPDAEPRHHTRVCPRRARGRLRGRLVAVPKLEILTAQ